MSKDIKELDPRTQRLMEIYEDSGFGSISAFNRHIGLNQTTMSNFKCGLRVPGERTLDMVLKAFPQYNRLWLMEGIGEKYNKEVVEVGGSNNSATEQNEKTLLIKLNEALEKIVQLFEKCASQEEQIKKYEAMINELKK